MSAPTYLVKNHNQIYYFRFVIPKDLQHHFPNHKREIRKSLKTRNRRYALQEARKLWVAMQTNIDEIESEIDDLEEGLILFNKLERAEKLAKYKNNSRIVDAFLANLSKQEEGLLKQAIEHNNELDDVSLEDYKDKKIDDLHAQSGYQLKAGQMEYKMKGWSTIASAIAVSEIAKAISLLSYAPS